MEEYRKMAFKYYSDLKMWIGFKNMIPMLFSTDGREWNKFHCEKKGK